MVFRNNPLAIFMICAIVIIALIIFHTVGWLKPVEGLVLKGLSPIQGFFYNIGSKTQGFFSFLASVKNLDKENKRLEEEIRGLRAELAQLKEVKRENEVLRQQLEFAKASEYKLLAAHVLGYDPSGLLQFVTINRGKEHGVVQGMPVIVSKGVLVGKIIEVSQATSKVMLILDPSSQVNGLIQESEASGVVKGERGMALSMDMIPQDIEIKPQDTVITSGLAGEFPRGLLIGQIEEVLRSDIELFQKARVKPTCDFKKLEIVFVILE